ncbi:MAG: 3-deoxy-7-phosphoheptulonate synthase [Spirochaetaceae bacterium]|nr:MAG: 3-deoxy-7-phosphoheptulonate synthase [Spirochaetaceae bacterium]
MMTPFHQSSAESTHNWNPDSWRSRPALHQPEYRDARRLSEVLDLLESLPPLVFPGEVDRLAVELADASEGSRFILHGGECVERFADCNEATIANRIRILLQMSIILTHAARKPVVRIGRMAGQFFKPRSRQTEIIDGQEVPTYKGDAVHGFETTQREPDPSRLLQGYFRASATLNYIRAMIAGGFADLHHPDYWNLRDMEHAPRYTEYQGIVERVQDAIHFMESFGGLDRGTVGGVDFFTSHEALHLAYEQSLTRRDGEKWYNLGAHMLWIGDRTRGLDGAHLEYLRGLSNPVGVKLGPDTAPDDLRDLCRILNPSRRAGKVVCITRLGYREAAERVIKLADAVQRDGMPVVWCCDPMHGNTVTTSGGHKTRSFDHIVSELRDTFAAHREAGSVLAGVHFEMTADPVTECIGGSIGLAEADLSRNYQSWCDPRLNYAQSLEVAFLIADHLRSQ